MSKRKNLSERRLLVVSQRRRPTEDGLARLVAAFVLYRLELEATGGQAERDKRDGESA